MARVIGSAMTGGIGTLMSAATVAKLGIDSDEVLAAAKEFVLSGIGQGSGRKGDPDTQPPAVKPEKYDQEYWKKNFYDKKDADGISLGKNSAAIAAEQLRIAMETGKNAYGNELTQAEINQVNKLRNEKYKKDKADRTIAKRASVKLENEIESNRESARAATQVDWKAAQAAKAKAAELASKTRTDRGYTPTNTTNNKDNYTYSPPAKTGGSTSGPKNRSGIAERAKNRQQQQDKDNSNQTMYAHGGLATKANKPKIKKMPKDNATGLASKMVAKQKTKAKKGALAAKRT